MWAGSRIFELGEPLRAAGWAMTTMGDIDRQAIAGAIATGTHGTGFERAEHSEPGGGAADRDRGGEVRELDSRCRDGDAMRAARVSLGALGVVSQVRLRLVPAFRLHERTWFEPPDECMARLEERIHATRHFEFFWMPVKDACFMKTLDPTERDVDPMPDRKGERIDWSDRVFPSERNVKFIEIEFSMAAEHGPACFGELRALDAREVQGRGRVAARVPHRGAGRHLSVAGSRAPDRVDLGAPGGGAAAPTVLSRGRGDLPGARCAAALGEVALARAPPSCARSIRGGTTSSGCGGRWIQEAFFSTST